MPRRRLKTARSKTHSPPVEARSRHGCTHPVRLSRYLQTSARPSSTAVEWASARGSRVIRHTDRSAARTDHEPCWQASAGLRWHLTYCVAPGGYTFTQALGHGGLDLCTPMFAPCLLGCPGTGRQDPVLMSLRLAGLRYSSACHSIPMNQVFKKVSLISGLLIHTCRCDLDGH